MTTGNFKFKEAFLSPESFYSNFPRIYTFVDTSKTYLSFISKIRNIASRLLDENPDAYFFYRNIRPKAEDIYRLRWCDLAAIRVLDYIEYSGLKLHDPNTDHSFVSDPLRTLWKIIRENRPVHPDFITDFYYLFRQLENKETITPPSRENILAWMARHPSALDPEMVKMRQCNRDRILTVLIRKMEDGNIRDNRYYFPEGLTHMEKLEMARKWWNERLFHLRFAVRNPDDLNEMLGNSIGEETMEVLKKAESKGIPFFVNPYYLSLLNIDESKTLTGTDLAIRSYILYSRELVNEFGQIHAWEKEDVVVPGKPNVAGWLLPPYPNIHRRYPEVSILIPDSMGRTCGGLCSSCQRMYDFQSGHLNFELDSLAPEKKWAERLEELLMYFRKDKQLRDILITGGDALMSTNRTLRQILEAVYRMARDKKKDNRKRPEGEKYAEMVRIRLGTRLPVYLPQRIDNNLIEILKSFREKATAIGFKQFFIQTHFETAMEITPEAAAALRKLQNSGWTVINQMVFSAAGSRRGHAAKLRKVLNDLGVLTYYTFSVKGYRENKDLFATNARLVQEQLEEKHIGKIPSRHIELLESLCENTGQMQSLLQQIKEKAKLPFLATDRSVLNMPGIGKSLTFRTIGLTPDGRRILLFDHDHTRHHSPIVEKMGKITIIESKSVSAYIRQMKEMGEDPEEYRNLYGYSVGVTEPQFPLFDYPVYSFTTTSGFNHIQKKEQTGHPFDVR
ncbi:MAG: KamA family protein [Chlorobi bacterium]|nr:KamA family protein [Chlorobiota bacterium]